MSDDAYIEEDLNAIEHAARTQQRAHCTMMQFENAQCMTIVALVEQIRRLRKALVATGVSPEMVRRISEGKNE